MYPITTRTPEHTADELAFSAALEAAPSRTLIAMTPWRHAAAVAGLQFWFEWALVPVSDALIAAISERDRLWGEQLYRQGGGFALLRRRVDRWADERELRPWPWSLHGVGATAWEAMHDGSSDYRQAISAHALHAHFCEAWAEIARLTAELASVDAGVKTAEEWSAWAEEQLKGENRAAWLRYRKVLREPSNAALRARVTADIAPYVERKRQARAADEAQRAADRARITDRLAFLRSGAGALAILP